MSSTEETIANIASFYAAQAHYYDLTYRPEEVERRYRRLQQRYRQVFQGCDILEVACGTGYWTAIVADVACSILATDINENVVERAEQRTRELTNVRCQVASAYSLDGIEGRFSGAFAQHWISHVPKRQLAAFLQNLHSKLERGAQLFFSDDTFYQHESVTRRTDDHGDIYEGRLRPDGSRAETIKNFPTRDELTALTEGVAEDIQYEEYQPEGLWTFSYRLR